MLMTAYTRQKYRTHRGLVIEMVGKSWYVWTNFVQPRFWQRHSESLAGAKAIAEEAGR